MRKNILIIVATAALVAVGMSSCGAPMDYKAESIMYSPSEAIYYDSVNGDETSFNTEEYNTIVENQFLSVQEQPLSTFSSDVDTASYAIVRRMINDGRAVNADAVRLEEMVNYFRYDYAEPGSGEIISVTQELIDCPWNEQSKLFMIGLRAIDIPEEERPESNLVYLVDVSGSMSSDDKLGLAIGALKILTENLSENDRISIVTYAGSEKVVLDGASGDDTRKIVRALDELTSGGSTHGSAGIEKAYNIAENHFIEGGNNRVILMTDGDLNVGITSEGDLKRLVETKAKSGIFLSVMGFGMGNYKDNKMEAMADNGNGNYYYIDSMREAKKVLGEEIFGTLFTVAKDAKFQVEFNPEFVKAYRLIGYENRKLNNQDFADDSKDAGDIGAGQNVTVLYELVLPDSDMEIPEIDLKYQDEAPVEGSDEWLTVSIRYKLPENSTSELRSYPFIYDPDSEGPTENIRFASCVVQFGMLLRDSEYKGSTTYNGIIRELSKLDSVSSDEYRREFLELVKKVND